MPRKNDAEPVRQLGESFYLGIIIVFIAIAVLFSIAVILLKGFDWIAGRGPKQVSDGIEVARSSENRIPCPMCAEKILPQAKICPFCKSEVKK
jgi:hypothetical protein